MIALDMVGTKAEVAAAVAALTASDAFESVILTQLKAYITAQLASATAGRQFLAGPLSLKLHCRCTSITNHLSLVLQPIRLVGNDRIVSLPNTATPAT